MRISSCLLTLAVLANAACVSPSSVSAPEETPTRARKFSSTAHHDYDEHKLIVRFRDAPRSLMNGAMLERVGAALESAFASIADGRLVVVKLNEDVSVSDALAALRDEPSVLYAEPSYTIRLDATPNDPSFGELYGMEKIHALAAWQKTVGSAEVVVGIVDTGVDYSHPDLAANMWVNTGEIAGNGIDDDQNGVIDDVHGFNAMTGSGDPLDDHAHGSHCAGTIGTVGDNSVGVVGVNWHTSIMALKFLDADGSGSTEGAIAAINYAIAQRRVGVNLRVLSNSWGGGEFSQALEDAIKAAGDVDILFVAAAGNDGTDNDGAPHYPSSYEQHNIVAVAATDQNDELADFSCFGASSVDVGAPGVGILSTIAGGGYAVYSGTSMATPHVAGVAALVLASNPTLDVTELKEVLLSSGDALPALAAKTVSGRRLNASAAIDVAGAPVPRFGLNLGATSAVVSQGEAVAFEVNITSLAGFAEAVALTADAGSDVTVSIEPASVQAPGHATITMLTRADSARGTRTVTITGTAGARVKTRTVSLRVRAAKLTESAFVGTDTPVSIPDSDDSGVKSTVQVGAIDVEEVRVQVDITHPYSGDIVLALIAPSGTIAVLQNGAGASEPNIHQTFALPSAFAGESGAGVWTLHVIDQDFHDSGTLDHWTLFVLGSPSR